MTNYKYNYTIICLGSRPLKLCLNCTNASFYGLQDVLHTVFQFAVNSPIEAFENLQY